jgi:hypothetical protein
MVSASPHRAHIKQGYHAKWAMSSRPAALAEMKGFGAAGGTLNGALANLSSAIAENSDTVNELPIQAHRLVS